MQTRVYLDIFKSRQLYLCIFLYLRAARTLDIRIYPRVPFLAQQTNKTLKYLVFQYTHTSSSMLGLSEGYELDGNMIRLHSVCIYYMNDEAHQMDVRHEK